MLANLNFSEIRSGSVLYKNLNGTIVFESGVPVVDNQFDLQKKADAERLRQEIVLKRH